MGNGKEQMDLIKEVLNKVTQKEEPRWAVEQKEIEARCHAMAEEIIRERLNMLQKSGVLSFARSMLGLPYVGGLSIDIVEMRTDEYLRTGRIWGNERVVDAEVPLPFEGLVDKLSDMFSARGPNSTIALRITVCQSKAYDPGRDDYSLLDWTQLPDGVLEITNEHALGYKEIINNAENAGGFWDKLKTLRGKIKNPDPDYVNPAITQLQLNVLNATCKFLSPRMLEALKARLNES